ncbi:MAG: threonylcarbamoyl-AMP synthase [Proteobacteria bacterium]|nr:threonylcarbamoyl-AMP synthase [Pseudomonadota bacterium]
MKITINPENPQPRLISQVVDILEKGGVIAYPTDTFYGIGCHLRDKRAIEKIYHLKRRPKTKPFSIICCDLKDISQYARVSNYAYKSMRRLLPGPYTFVLEATHLVPKIMLTKRKTVGLRVPDHNVCRAIVRELGSPIISTSATLPDGTVLADPHDIDQHLGHALDAVIDAGPISVAPSSVVSLIDDAPEVIRAGQGDVRMFV